MTGKKRLIEDLEDVLNYRYAGSSREQGALIVLRDFIGDEDVSRLIDKILKPYAEE